MADFVIKLSDERGHVTERMASAPSEAEVRERLLEQGLFVVGVKPRGLVLGGRLAVAKRAKVKLGPFVVFNQQFVTLIKSGLPIHAALQLLANQQKEESFRVILHNVCERVKAGELLSEAFQVEGLPKIYSTTLLAGEKSGNLEEALSRYVHFQRVALSFKKKLKTSLIYPTLLISMVFIITTFLVTFVVPRFAGLYSQLGAELPVITQFMLAFGQYSQRYFTVGFAALFLLAIGLWRWKRTEKGELLFDQLRLAVPIAGTIWLKYQVSIFTRMMSTLLSGGLPLVPALETAGASIQSRRLALAVKEAAVRVCEGQPLAQSLKEAGRFPDLSVELIEVGESTGALSQMLSSVAEFYEEDVETALAAALSLIEPAILMIMAVVVGFVLISLYLPIFKLGGGLQ